VGKNLIQIYDAKEYFYGTHPDTCGEQKGVYNRDFVTLRVEHVDPELMLHVHNQVLKLIEEDRKESRFHIFLGPVLNSLRHFFPTLPQYGNCARWTSTMLKEAGLVSGFFVWPKTVFINMFENYSRNNIKTVDNMNIIYYEQPESVKILSYGVRTKPVWFEKTVAPFQLVRNFFYGDLKHFAKIVVRVPRGDTHAYLIHQSGDQVSQPNEWRNLLNSKYYILSSLVVSLVIYKKGWYHTKAQVTHLYQGLRSKMNERVAKMKSKVNAK
jgi:hypothetical protein